MNPEYTRPSGKSSKFVSKLIEEALSTHLSVNYSHIGVAIDVLSLIYFTDEQLALFILYISQTTTTGQFALSYNHDIDKAIFQNNTNQLIYLAETNQDEFFAELYDNPDLSSSDKKTIEKIKNVEYLSILQLINTYNRQEYDEKIEQKSPDVPKSFLNLCPREDETEVCEVIDGNSVCTKMVPTYDSCYKQICIDSKKENFLSSSNTPTVNVPSDKVEIYGEIEKREIMCLPYMEFIKMLTTGSNKFAKHLIPSYKKQYAKEIAMYSRYLRQKLDDYIF